MVGAEPKKTVVTGSTFTACPVDRGAARKPFYSWKSQLDCNFGVACVAGVCLIRSFPQDS